MEYVGRRSRYNKSAPPSTSVQQHSPRNGTSLLFNDAADGGGEDRTGQKAHLVQQHAQAQTAYRELDNQVRAKKDEIRGVRDRMQPLKDARMDQHRLKNEMPKKLKEKIAMEKRKRDEYKSRLSKTSEKELRDGFVRVMDDYLECVASGMGHGHTVLARQVEVAAARQCVYVLEDELADANQVT